MNTRDGVYELLVSVKVHRSGRVFWFNGHPAFDGGQRIKNGLFRMPKTSAGLKDRTYTENNVDRTTQVSKVLSSK